MKLDSIAIASVVFETKKNIIPAKIIELYQPSKYEILFVLKSKKGIGRLFFSIRPDRMAFFRSESLIPSENFTSLFFNHLQNWLQGADLLDIEHYQFDRIIKLIFQPYIKFGTTKNYQLIIEFMGKHSNAVLVDEQLNIKSAIKQVGSEVNRFREIKPGIPYVYPPKQDKHNPLSISQEMFLNLLNDDIKNNDIIFFWQFLQHNFSGLGKKSAKEIVTAMGLSSQYYLREFSQGDYARMWQLFSEVVNKIANNIMFPAVIIDKKSNNILDYSLLSPVTKKEDSIVVNFKETSNCLEFVFNRLTEQDKKKELYQNINKILNKNIKKFEKMKNIFQKKKKDIESSEEYRKKGELIKANLYRIKPGVKEVSLVDYIDNEKEIIVSLNPDFNPVQNAEYYFNKYKKLQQNSKNIKQQAEEIENAFHQLEEIRKKTEENKDSLEILSDIYKELSKSGYIKTEKRINTKRKKPQPNISKFISPDGWTIIVGKNNKQNEYLLRYLSSGNDFWLHNLTSPGGHIIIKNHKNLDNPPFQTLLFAARLAGYYSKIKDKEYAIIIYTQRKYVKKPKNSKPGKVIYSNEKTLQILINHDEIKNDMHKMWTG
ncbi:MAG: NFACT RNA binding domain-containing protein [Atribacterota bacterium]|nr:NFACT RNA binding domain-containing protein [Atribacterota bacterium]